MPFLHIRLSTQVFTREARPFSAVFYNVRVYLLYVERGQNLKKEKRKENSLYATAFVTWGFAIFYVVRYYNIRLGGIVVSPIYKRTLIRTFLFLGLWFDLLLLFYYFIVSWCDFQFYFEINWPTSHSYPKAGSRPTLGHYDLCNRARVRIFFFFSSLFLFLAEKLYKAVIKSIVDNCRRARDRFIGRTIVDEVDRSKKPR